MTANNWLEITQTFQVYSRTDPAGTLKPLWNINHDSLAVFRFRIYFLLKDVVNIPDYKMSNEKMISKWWIKIVVGGSDALIESRAEENHEKSLIQLGFEQY